MDAASLVCSISGGLFVLVEDPRTKPVQGAERVPLTLAIELGCYIFDEAPVTLLFVACSLSFCALDFFAAY